MIKSISTYFNDKPFKWIQWQVNLHCPFKCFYCDEFTWGSKETAPFSWDVYDRMADEVIKRFEYGHIDFTGGEPSTFPYINQLIDKFHNNGFTTGVISNVSKNLEAYKSWIGRVGYIAATYHSNVIKTDKQREVWFSKVETLAKDIPIIVRVMMDPNHWDHCLEIHKTLSTANIKVVEPVRIVHLKTNFMEDPALADTYYTDEQNKIIDELDIRFGAPSDQFIPSKSIIEYSDHTQVNTDYDAFFNVAKLSRSRQNNFKGWECDVGIKSLWIQGDGRIARATCDGYELNFFGNINDLENIQWPTEPTICPYKLCFCDTDMIVSKRKI